MATFGKTAIGGGAAGAAANLKRGCKFTLGEKGDITSFSIYGRDGGVDPNFYGAIYDDNAGSPNALKATSAVQNIADANAWTTFNITVTLNAGDYWLTYLQNALGTQIYFDAGAANQMCQVADAAPPSDPWGGTAFFAWDMSIYCTYTPVAPPAGATSTGHVHTRGVGFS